MLMFCYSHAAGSLDGGYSVRCGDYFEATDAQAGEILRVGSGIPVEGRNGIVLARPLTLHEFSPVAKRLFDRPADLARLIVAQRAAIVRFAVPADRLQVGGTPWPADVQSAVLDLTADDEREEMAGLLTKGRVFSEAG